MAERVPIWYDVEYSGPNPLAGDVESASSLAEIAARLRADLDLSGVAIAIENPELSRIICIASSGRSAPARGSVLDLNSGICAMCVRENRTLISNDAGSDPRVSRDACQALGIGSLLVIPLKEESRCMGILLAIAHVANRFNAENTDRIEQAALDAAKALCRGATAAAKVARPEIRKVPRRHRPLLLALWLLATGLSAALLTGGAFLRIKAMSPVHASSEKSAAVQRLDQASYKSQRDHDLRATAPGLVERAESGNVPAQVELAHRYFKGDGVVADRIRASVWYIVAGENGDVRAKQSAVLLTRTLSPYDIAQIRFNVGKMYMDGIGLRRDLGQAYSWFALAQAAGDVRAATEQQRLEQMMTPLQVSEALQRASDWLLAHRSGIHTVPTIIADSGLH